MTDSTFWCEHALVNGTVADAVRFEITDGRFTAIAAGQPAGDTRRLLGLSLPGFANAHSHAFHRALRARSQADSGSFWTWREIMYSAAERLEPDSYFRLARAVFAEMAVTGIAAVGEFHYVHHPMHGGHYDNPNAMGEAVLAAAAEAGIRMTLLDTIYLHGGLAADGYTEPTPLQARFSDGNVDNWLARVDELKPNDRQKVGAAIHSVRAVDRDACAVVGEWARNAGAPLHAHVSEQALENEQCQAHYGMSPTALLDDAGALSPIFVAVHATHLDEHDIDLFAASDSAVCVCPTTERDLGDGIGPTSELTSAGVALSLGSDSHAVIDHIEEARALELHDRLRTERRGLHAATDLVDMATVNGHRQLGWHDAGRLQVGARADITTVALDSTRTAGAPASLALENVIFAAQAADVTSVIVDGAIIAERGVHCSIEVERELTQAIGALLS